MYIEQQPVEILDKSRIAAKAEELRKDGWRLVVITCILRDSFELTYTFDKDYKYRGVRLSVDRNDATVPSITASYLAAFTYENELQDLFGLKVSGLALDFKGTFYKTTVKTPWNRPETQPQAK